MKKIYLLPLLLLFFTACSVDSDEILTQEKDTAETIHSSARASLGDEPEYYDEPVLSCFNNLLAHVSINVSNGLNNPIVNFVGDAPLSTPASAAYIVKVEVQQLADCEDFNLITGSPIFFGGSTFTNVGVVAPSIAVAPRLLPACYKWRISFERSIRSVKSCKTYSPWYDAPLF